MSAALDLDHLGQAYSSLCMVGAAAERDPLSYWRFAVPRLRTALSMLVGPDRIYELAAQGPNKGTKTETLTAYMLGCLEKRPQLDLCPLPQWRGPVEGLCGVLDFKQQLLSVQPAYQRLLGGWPHRVRRTGEAWAALTVCPMGPDGRPDESGDESTWSKLHFLSQENREAGKGARADLVQVDEPGKMWFLQEIRKAGHAGRNSILLHGFTPTIRSQWAAIRDEYEPVIDGQRRINPRSRITVINPYTAVVRWSLSEVADWVLGPAEKAMMEARYANDPIRSARLHGDFSNEVGSCPFYPHILERMRAHCRPPVIRQWEVAREAPGGDGRLAGSVKIPVKIWKPREQEKSYYIPADPASGSLTGDPLALTVAEMGTGDLCASYSGHIPPYALGVLMAVLARQYNGAVVQPEINDGWATGVFDGLADSRYGNIGKERRPDGKGGFINEKGFKTTEKTRPGKISAIQKWVLAWDQGARYAACPSEELIDCLLDCILDDNDKAVAAPGFHDELMILWGQSLTHTVPRGGAQVPHYPAGVTENQRMARMIQGRDDPARERPARAPRLRTRTRGGR